MVDSAEEQKESGDLGGKLLTYKDKTKQDVKVMAKSELDFSVSWTVIKSEPAVKYTSVTHSVKCSRITTQLDKQAAKTFVQWESVFSGDATADVVQDSKFKKRTAFKDL